MDSLIAFLILVAGFMLAIGGYAWWIEAKPQRNTYRMVITSCALYSLALFLGVFFPYKPQSLLSSIIVVLLSIGMAAAAIWVWRKYQKAYPQNTVSE